MKLSICRCPVHPDFWSVSIDDDFTSARVTPSKCCGRWNTVKAFTLSAREWRTLSEEAENAAEETERGKR